MQIDAKMILAALLAVAIALKADIGGVPMSVEVKAYVDWALTGIAAGLTVVLGPEIADAVRALFKPKVDDSAEK